MVQSFTSHMPLRIRIREKMLQFPQQRLKTVDYIPFYTRCAISAGTSYVCVCHKSVFYHKFYGNTMGMETTIKQTPVLKTFKVIVVTTTGMFLCRYQCYLLSKSQFSCTKQIKNRYFYTMHYEQLLK